MACQKNLASKFLKMCILAGLLPQQSISVSSSPGSSTHERCHPEDVLLSISSRGVALPWPVADGCLVHVDVNGVAQGSRYEARLSLVKQGLLVHEEWLQFQGADQQVPSQPTAPPSCWIESSSRYGRGQGQVPSTAFRAKRTGKFAHGWMFAYRYAQVSVLIDVCVKVAEMQPPRVTAGESHTKMVTTNWRD